MRTSRVLLAVLASVTASCGGSSSSDPATESTTTEALESPAEEPSATDPPPTDPTPTDPPPTDPPMVPEPVAAFSDDGVLGVAVGGTDATETDVSVRLLDQSEWPAELQSPENLPGVKIFELEPDGATFDEPVTVTRRLDVAAFDSLDLGPHDVPLVTMLTQNDDGDYELLDDLTLMRLGDALFVSGTTTHFSPIIISNENRMIPFLPGEEDDSVDPATVTDFAEIVEGVLADGGPLGPVPGEAITGDGPAGVLWQDTPFGDHLSATDTYDVITRLVEQGAPPTDGAFTLRDDDGVDLPSEPLDVIEGPTMGESSSRAQRFGQSFPAIPISLAQSSQTLLPDSEELFQLTVIALEIALTPEEYGRLVEDIVEDAGFPWAFGITPRQMRFEVFHRTFGAYPSEVFVEFLELVIDDRFSGYVFSWEGGTPTRDTPIVDIRPAVFGEDNVGAALGIECFCRYNVGVIVSESELPPELLDRSNAPALWDHLATDPSVSAAMVADGEGGSVVDFAVTANEGELFRGEVFLDPLRAP